MESLETGIPRVNILGISSSLAFSPSFKVADQVKLLSGCFNVTVAFHGTLHVFNLRMTLSLSGSCLTTQSILLQSLL